MTNLIRPIALITRIYNLKMTMTPAQVDQFNASFKPYMDRFRAGELTWRQIFDVVDKIEGQLKCSSTETTHLAPGSKQPTRSYGISPQSSSDTPGRS